MTSQPIAWGLVKNGGLRHKFVDQGVTKQLTALNGTLEKDTDIVAICIEHRLHCPDLTAVVDRTLLIKAIDLQGQFDRNGKPIQAIIVRAELPREDLPTLQLNTSGMTRQQALPPGLRLSP